MGEIALNSCSRSSSPAGGWTEASGLESFEVSERTFMLFAPKINNFVLDLCLFEMLMTCATCEGIPCWGEAGRFKEGGETGGEGGGDGEDGRLWGR